MTPRDENAPAPPSDPELDANTALSEIDKAKTSVRAGLRWNVLELLGAAVLLSGTPFVMHLYPQKVALWLWIGAPLLLALAASIAWRRRVVGRIEGSFSQRAITLAIALSLAAMFILDRIVPAGLSPLVVGIAAIPALPLLVAAMRVVSK